MSDFRSDAASLYYAAQEALIHLEAAEAATEEVTEQIRERLDVLWKQMSDSERRSARERSAELLRTIYADR